MYRERANKGLENEGERYVVQRGGEERDMDLRERKNRRGGHDIYSPSRTCDVALTAPPDTHASVGVVTYSNTKHIPDWSSAHMPPSA